VFIGSGLLRYWRQYTDPELQIPPLPARNRRIFKFHRKISCPSASTKRDAIELR